MSSQFRMAIDIGGTFTDTVLMDGEGRLCASAKTATTPSRPAMGALAGARAVLDEASVAWPDISGFVHGTTLATNALIERRGACVATLTTAGFRDILEIGYERRYSQYAINISKPDLLVPRERAFTIGGRMDASGCERAPLDVAAVPDLVDALKAQGVEALAICLLHAYANPSHELAVAEALRAAWPELVVSLSHDISPEAREFDRLCTTVANAYIQPLMADYLGAFETAFEAEGLRCPILMMTAGGGMTTLQTAARLPIRLVESGPAGGAILAAHMAHQVGAQEVLSFDMGGTTAKLCLIDAYHPQTARHFEIARAARFIKGSGMPVRIPVVDMIEIGAGGGSIAARDRLGRLSVGPQSAGADPGPAAFSKGGTQPTVTDADIALGYIQADGFAEGRLSLDPGLAKDALETVLLGRPEEMAFGVSDLVDEAMASAGRMHAVETGKDLGARVMIAFGGNGPLHATRVARRARVQRILVPPSPGVGSAVGFLYAPVSFEIVRSRYATLTDLDWAGLNGFLAQMQAEAEAVVRQGAPDGPLRADRSAFMRYRGQGHELEVTLPDRPLTAADAAGLQDAFEAEYRAQFQRVVPAMEIEILNWGLRLIADRPRRPEVATQTVAYAPTAHGTCAVICDRTGSQRQAALYQRGALAAGASIVGPALIQEPQTTTWVSSDFAAHVDGFGNLWLVAQEGETS